MNIVQEFDDDYLEECRKMSPDDIAVFLDEFRQLHAAKSHATRNRELAKNWAEELHRKRPSRT